MTVTICSVGGDPPQRITRMVSGRITPRHIQRDKINNAAPGWEPREGDLALFITSHSLSATVERDARRRGAIPVVVPEGADWASGQISKAVDADRDVWIWA